ncbi:MAG: hypothetical protein EXS31_10225 [Pedosphaera sp.]|nr:hypothetical protein [Pedosphaera sp.]
MNAKTILLTCLTLLVANLPALAQSNSRPPLPTGEGRSGEERRGQNFQPQQRFDNAGGPPAYQAPNNFNPQPPPQNFNADGPWNRDVIAYRVSSSGAVEKAATFERAGVPTIARLKDGRLIVAHQHFPENDRENFDKVAVHFSSDDGQTWTSPQVIQVADLPEGMRFPFDPTLVPLPDGRVRLYFTGNLGRTFQRSTPAIHSAISTNGVNYTYEPGVRFNVEGRMIIDCAAVLHQGAFHLFVPDNGVGLSPGQRPGNEPAADRPREGVGYHATSKDGLNFTRLDDVQIEGRRRWLGNAESDGKLITFYGTGEGMNSGANAGGRPRGGFWMASSEDGKSWKLVANPPIGGGDPGAVKTRDGGLLVVITGESRLRSSGRRADFQPQQNPDNAGGSPALQARRAAPQIPSNPANDFEPPVGRDENSPRESPGHFRLLTAWSSDGLTFTPTGQVISDQANVPDLIAGPGGAIHLYYSGGQVGDRENTLALAISTDQGKSWNFKHVEVEGGGLKHAGDPDIVRLDDGTFRIFLTSTVNGRHGVIYCDSPDGIHFTKRGTAFAKAGLELLDSTTFRLGATWHMLTLEGAGTTQRHGTSSDGREFTVGEKIPFDADGESYIAANGVPVDGGYRIYGFSLPAQNFRSFISKDGRSWTAEKGVRLALDAKSSLGGAQIKDPSVLRLADGSCLMVYVARLPETRGETISPATRSRSAGGPPARRDEEFGVPASAGREPDGSQRLARAEGRPPEGGTPNFPARGEQFGQRGQGGQVRVEKIDSKYKTAPGARPGSFVAGQDADLMLGGFGFNNSGGALHFNHPTGLATDGKALLMTDRWNNRVFLWKSAPAKNTPPDLVLGQPDFTQNHSGGGRHQLNWPGNVAITPDGNRIAVTDTSNDRILIWNSFPTRNGQAADLVLDLDQLSGEAPASGPARGASDPERRFPNRRDNEPSNANRAELEFGAPPRRSAGPVAGAPRQRFGDGMRFSWPWGVWTDGKKLAVVATHGSAVLLWNSLPTRDNQPPDLVLRPSAAGTPRNVTSDGKTFFAVSDHNNGDNSRPATMVWNSFPTSSSQQPDWKWSEWVKGSFAPDGKLVVGGLQSVYVWDKAPRDAETEADVVLRPTTYRNGDGPDAVVANGRLYVCTYNGNHLLGWNALPTRDNQPADFAIGSERTDQDTWKENFFIQNPVVATDGKSLFVTSDFDRKMFVWKTLPDESAAKPDLVMHLPEGPWDNELHGSTLALAGRSSVSIWKKLPLNGEQPDIVLRRRIGSVELGELTGVAFDDKYFYLSDRRSESIYVWEGIPTRDSEPKFTLAMRSPGRLTSDGKYLCAAPFEGNGIQMWRVSELIARTEPITLGGRGQFNLPSECLVADGRLLVCNRSFNRVEVWNRVEDALASRPADAFLGANDAQDRKPGIGRNKMFMPGSLAWGNGYLWVGEFKFSTRILRFSPQAKPSAASN